MAWRIRTCRAGQQPARPPRLAPDLRVSRRRRLRLHADQHLHLERRPARGASLPRQVQVRAHLVGQRPHRRLCLGDRPPDHRAQLVAQGPARQLSLRDDPDQRRQQPARPHLALVRRGRVDSPDLHQGVAGLALTGQCPHPASRRAKAVRSTLDRPRSLTQLQDALRARSSRAIGVLAADSLR